MSEGAHNGLGRHLDDDLCRDLLSGLLSDTEKLQVLEHVAACARCERFFAERVVERERLRAPTRLRTSAEGQTIVERVAPATRDAAPEEGPRSFRDLLRFWPRLAVGAAGTSRSCSSLCGWGHPRLPLRRHSGGYRRWRKRSEYAARPRFFRPI